MSGGPVPVFKKYTTGSTGIWEVLRQWLTLVPNRSSGNPYVPFYRVPAPTSEPHQYKDSAARTIPASDIIGNEYSARDHRRNFPRMSTFDQSQVGVLLKLGNQTISRLPKGDAGVKALAQATSNDVELTSILKSCTSNVIKGEVLNKDGGPIVAPTLNKSFKLRILNEDEHGMYDTSYPVRMFK